MKTTTTTTTLNAHISSHNSKTGIPSFNLLAGSSNHKYTGYISKSARKDLLNVCGTCGCNDCPGCYAKKMSRFTAVYNNFAENTLLTYTAAGREIIYNTISTFVKPTKRKQAPPFFRIHDSGDFNSLEYLTMWDRIATENPDIIFYCYTKRIDLLKEFKAINGRDPAFTFQLSTWEGICEYIDIVNAGFENAPLFEYDDGTREDLKHRPHCPAVNKHGKRTGVKCIQCQHCMKCKAGDVWAVYAH